ncbi:MAG: hypothetical protein IJJ25_11210 [Lachnospiraceae bacterium]|nr:hypothetical protein [Lachnospiraceae bacterium]
MGKRDVFKNSGALFERKIFRAVLMAALVIGFCLAVPAGNAKAAGYGLKNPVIDKSGVTTWDCIWFGNYYQTSSSVKEPVKWRVLNVSGSDALILADVNLDCVPYHDAYDYVTWEDCSLRKWLNNDFLNAAFNAQEKLAVKTVTNQTDISPFSNFTMSYGGNDTRDRVFCLAWEDLVNPRYGFPEGTGTAKARAARNSDYAAEKGVLVSKAEGCEGNSWWWLRTPGYYNKCACFISHDGAFPVFSAESGGLAVSSYYPGVRPALHINLARSVWTKAGQVTSEDKESTTKSEEGEEASEEDGKDSSKITPSDAAADAAKENKSIPTVNVKEKKLTLSADLHKKTMNVKFKKVSKAVNYRVAYRKGGAAKWTYDWTDGKNNYTFARLKKDQLLEFRIAPYAKTSSGWERGKWSSITYKWFADTTASAKAINKGFTVKVKKIKKATGYQVLYGKQKKIAAALSKGKIKSLKAAQGGREIKIRSLKKKTVYYIRWRPVMKYKGKKYTGIWKGAEKIKTK